MSPSRDLHVVVTGDGAPVLFIHGSAADHSTWIIQQAGLRSRLRLITYDRRGTGKSPLPEGTPYLTVEQHAADAAELIRLHGAGQPMVVVGSSFGGVVALELARSRPEQLWGAVLLEPPLASSDEVPPIPQHFLQRFDDIAITGGGPAAAEFFLRSVLGDAAWARIPRPFQERSKSLHASIRQDIAALGDYPVRYGQLSAVKVPILLLGGERSAEFYRPTLIALQQHLGNAKLEVLAGAGHMMHADVHRKFNERLLAFIDETA